MAWMDVSSSSCFTTHAALQRRRILPRPPPPRNLEHRHATTARRRALLTFSLPKPIESGRITHGLGPLPMASTDNNTGEEVVEGNELDSKAKQYGYKPPAHSESFLRHLESVDSAWPYDPNDDSDGESDMSRDGETSNIIDGGVRCTGEPAMDPSRMLQSIVDDDYDWI